MALKADIRGMVWKYPHPFLIGREQIRQYAKAVKAMDPASHDEAAAAELGHDTLVAPLTFASTLALLVQEHFFQNVDIGMETKQIVQVDQKFVYRKPLKAGDQLHAVMKITSVEERFGADIVVTHNVCTDDDGEVVLEAITTMMGHDADDSIQVKWDPETGKVVRKAAGE
ncbi:MULTISPECIES: (3R)-hydroxyacyl-ACP dehydratase subunit HadC [unclassified Mycolicibacterium]|uniref:(3R)-hydroxyacyl-ACP dehydratase subunit HadC n=1 Tax=unclassified Mycolicibacterium TaxID=2636767 RepID=UPI0012DE1296|nr:MULTISPECIES: (3R)-hydroxyacyl-ACP dehydratase subunit HadC [unclassified Mycolicibacterium]MUL81522.1 (3R)-hydroxyacyl-ACP dehydratase subunit HadC [Mycolicibacterium sp. CBMA 329]MUL87288.1 (3R)-hydroxyacyl-ACP dehydratase subunit HadC [Mycolicibacterium sp. CBMA 331]MUM02575.1 (3R)-hydroxyacyl-ACP dehydratase subunit HadC [Mycolicibacterium sp. CBMA 334]MUM25189.1 (3R)-hydroxyacyl-ACP dehydratase subunit HadC [Mycolicibacterium sp. CBMA 295]MUM37585.1 (3R)-hydroxyacyl-ACP dehydratase sub